MLNLPRWKIALVFVLCLLGFIYAAPNVLSTSALEKLPGWLPVHKINLGLDLQGGSHLLLEVETDAVLAERIEVLVDSVRTDLRNARIRYTGLGARGTAVAVTVAEPGRVDEAANLLRKIDQDAVLSRGDSGQLTLTLSERAVRDRRTAAIEQSIEIVRRRIDETGVREPTIQRQGEQRILLQLPGLDDPERVKRLIGRTARMSFHLLDAEHSLSEAVGGRVPPGAQLLPSASDTNPDGQPRMYLVQRRVAVSGDTLVDSQPSFDQRTNEPVVSFRFDNQGARRFAQITQENVGRPFAIVLDKRVISAPVIREPILGGTRQISGSFSVGEANDLALLLRAGALPAPLTILEERTVGPGLGADSVEAGKIACIVGFVLVVVLMAVSYGFFGVLANVALLVNLVLILAVLSALQASLTLPGIAGIVLTLGMAVDANVLIFERIREELRAGRTPFSAVDTGYARAMSTIIDSNLTTLIAALFLYIFGSGPVRGFAVTLSIGIITSMFSAIMLTRIMIVLWLKRARPRTLTF